MYTSLFALLLIQVYTTLLWVDNIHVPNLISKHGDLHKDSFVAKLPSGCQTAQHNSHETVLATLTPHQCVVMASRPYKTYCKGSQDLICQATLTGKGYD